MCRLGYYLYGWWVYKYENTVHTTCEVFIAISDLSTIICLVGILVNVARINEKLMPNKETFRY